MKKVHVVMYSALLLFCSALSQAQQSSFNSVSGAGTTDG